MTRLDPRLELTRRQLLFGVAGTAAAGALGCGGGADGISDAFVLEDGAICSPTRSDLKGPFFEPGAPMRVSIADATEPGERLMLTGRVLGPDCVTPLAGVVVDIWQADRDGRYYTAAQQYRLRGQVVTGASGMFQVETIRPGNYLQGTGYRPAHLHFTFTGAGHRTLTTQIYFAGDPYLAPADSCGTCGSNDPERILALAGDSAGWSGEMTIKLASG